jgi:multiple sugar transport system ATP-binding protein
MIYVTHDQVEAMTLADRIVVLRSGRIEQVGTPLDLYNRPANRFVAGFIGAPRMNFLDATVAAGEDGGVELRLAGTGGVIRWGPREVAAGAGAGAGAGVTLGIRPQHIGFAPSADEGVPATVRLVEALGSETIVHTDLEDGRPLLAVLQGQHRLSAGEKVGLRIDREKTHLFGADGNRLEGAAVD